MTSRARSASRFTPTATEVASGEVAGGCAAAVAGALQAKCQADAPAARKARLRTHPAGTRTANWNTNEPSATKRTRKAESNRGHGPAKRARASDDGRA